MSLLSVERVFKFVGSVPQGDDVKRKDLLVCFSWATVNPCRPYIDTVMTKETCLCRKGVCMVENAMSVHVCVYFQRCLSKADVH